MVIDRRAGVQKHSRRDQPPADPVARARGKLVQFRERGCAKKRVRQARQDRHRDAAAQHGKDQQVKATVRPAGDGGLPGRDAVNLGRLGVKAPPPDQPRQRQQQKQARDRKMDPQHGRLVGHHVGKPGAKAGDQKDRDEQRTDPVNQLCDGSISCSRAFHGRPHRSGRRAGANWWGARIPVAASVADCVADL